MFVTACAACHGEDARGTATWRAEPHRCQVGRGGDLDAIIASVHGGRRGHMPTWDERLTPAEIRTLALYVHDLGTQQP